MTPGRLERETRTLDGFFEGFEPSRPLFEALRAQIESLGPVEIRVGKSQVAFARRRGFAWAWVPDRYLHGRHAPLVLSVSLPHRDASPRWKEVVEPAPGRFMHHLELGTLADVDEEVRGWLREAREAAG